jgi:hypothetical protein
MLCGIGACSVRCHSLWRWPLAAKARRLLVQHLVEQVVHGQPK